MPAVTRGILKHFKNKFEFWRKKSSLGIHRFPQKISANLVQPFGQLCRHVYIYLYIYANDKKSLILKKKKFFFSLCYALEIVYWSDSNPFYNVQRGLQKTFPNYSIRNFPNTPFKLRLETIAKQLWNFHIQGLKHVCGFVRVKALATL